MIIFDAKWHDGQIFQVLVKVLKKTVKQVTLQISDTGISLNAASAGENVVIDASFPRDKFALYTYVNAEPIHIAIKLKNVFKILRTMKKRDSLRFFIDNLCMERFHIVIEQPVADIKSSRRVNSANVPPQQSVDTAPILSTSILYTSMVQQVELLFSDAYTNAPVVIPTSEFNRAIRDLKEIHEDEFTLVVRDRSIMLRASVENVYSREIVFGDLRDVTPITHRANYSVDFFTNLNKINGLGDTLTFFAGSDSRLKLEVGVGAMGAMSVYIRSRENEVRTQIPPHRTSSRVMADTNSWMKDTADVIIGI